MRIAVIGTGGTISSAVGSDGALRPGLSSAAIFDLVGRPADVDFTTEDLMSVDSAALSFERLDTIVAAIHAALADPTIDGVIVLHGTDTVEETALLADLQHDDPRPVLFVAAMRPVTAPDSDVATSLQAAVTAILDPALLDSDGVHIVTDGTPRPALGTRKVHTTALEAFRNDPLPRRTVSRRAIAGTRVDVVALYPGADAAAIDAFVAAGARGLVLEALGAGNTSPEIVAAVRRISERIAVVVSTRVHDGHVVPAYSGGGGAFDLVTAGAVISPVLRSGQARILLATLLAGGSDIAVIRDWYETHS